MDLSERCRRLLEQIADRVPPDVLAKARSYGADGEWEAALIGTGNAGVKLSAEEQDLRNDLLSELAAGRKDPRVHHRERRLEILVHPSHFQYYVHDLDWEYDPMVEPVEAD